MLETCCWPTLVGLRVRFEKIGKAQVKPNYNLCQTLLLLLGICQHDSGLQNKTCAFRRNTGYKVGSVYE
jgi:hypothetical protein